MKEFLVKVIAEIQIKANSEEEAEKLAMDSEITNEKEYRDEYILDCHEVDEMGCKI